jgi:hypothetical protein
MKLFFIAAALIIPTAAAANDCKLVSDGSVRVWQCAPTPTSSPPSEEKK